MVIKKKTSSKIIALTLTLVLVLGLMPALTVSAASAADLASTIDAITGLNAVASGNTVNVTGGVSSGASALALNIDDGVTVNWNADYIGGPGSTLIALTGAGSFNLNGGTVENTGDGNTIDANCHRTTISGGTVKSNNGQTVQTSAAAAGNPRLITINGSGVLERQAGMSAVLYLHSNVHAEINGAAKLINHSTSSDSAQTVIISATSAITIGGDAVLQANSGRNISGNGGTVTINDNAKLITTSGSSVMSFNSDSAYSANVTINGGMLMQEGGTSDVSIRSLNPASTITINGGSIKGTMDSASIPRNGAGANVYLNTYTIAGQANKGITAFNYGGVTSYGLSGVTTDGDGKLFFYLPASSGMERVAAMVSGVSTPFQANYTRAAANNNAWDLYPQGSPGAPVIGTATPGTGEATVAFTAPTNDGGFEITGYTVTSSPGGFTGTGTSSPITVSGLDGIAYTFTVTATNSAGTGVASAASDSVTPTVYVTHTAIQTGGASGTADSKGIILTFSQAVTGLTADDITITNGTGAAVKGAVSGSGTDWTVALSSVTTEGYVNISVANFGGFYVTTPGRTVSIYKDARTPVTFSATQTGGTSGTANSTGIVLTFDQAVTGLTASDITITNDTGAAVKGALSGSGTTYTIALSSVITEGNVTVEVAGFGEFNVTTTPQTVAVYKDANVLITTGWSINGTTVVSGEWQTGALYYLVDGEPLKAEWLESNDGIRYFGEDGKMYVGIHAMNIPKWISEDDLEFVLDVLLIQFQDNGVRVGTYYLEGNGLYEYNGKQLYFVGGLAFRGWILSGAGIAYNYDDNAATGIVQLSNPWKDVSSTETNPADPTAPITGTQWVGHEEDEILLFFNSSGIRIDIYAVIASPNSWYNFKTHDNTTAPLV